MKIFKHIFFISIICVVIASVEFIYTLSKLANICFKSKLKSNTLISREFCLFCCLLDTLISKAALTTISFKC